MTSATLAFQGAGDEGLRKEERSSWQEVAEDFWSASNKADADEKKRKKPKLHRNKLYEWLCATCHMLQIALGHTWNLELL